MEFDYKNPVIAALIFTIAALFVFIGLLISDNSEKRGIIKAYEASVCQSGKKCNLRVIN